MNNLVLLTMVCALVMLVVGALALYSGVPRTAGSAWRGEIFPCAHRITALARSAREEKRFIEALTTSLVVSALLVGAPTPASAESIWLDEPISQWNQPGMPVPAVPRSDTEPESDPRCSLGARPVEIGMDSAVANAGWSLFNPYEAGWGIALLFGLSGYDGMCRPALYHAFVFVDGAFAGTLAPVPSFSRTDGALTRDARIEADGRLGAVFVRYAPEDPLCCPSQPSVAVSYRVERTPQGPVLLVDRMSQIPKM